MEGDLIGNARAYTEKQFSEANEHIDAFADALTRLLGAAEPFVWMHADESDWGPHQNR